MKNKKIIIVISVLSLAILFIWRLEFLRFESPRLNYIALGYALVSLWFINTKIFSGLYSKIFRWIVIIIRIVTFPILLLWILNIVLSSEIIIDDIDYSFEKIETLQIEGSNYIVYITNHGAMTSFGIIIRKEIKIIPGFIKYVQRVYDKDPASFVESYKIENGEPVFYAK